MMVARTETKRMLIAEGEHVGANELGQTCVGTNDCVEGICLDGRCQLELCSNMVLDADNGETGVDCPGVNHAPCVAGLS